MSDALLTQHPLSAAFPAMTDAAFAEFRADIAQNGLRQPIIVYEEQVLTAGIAIAPAAMSACRLGSRHFRRPGGGAEVRDLGESDAAAFRREPARPHPGRLATMPAHRPGKRANLPTSLTTADAAELLNVGERHGEGCPHGYRFRQCSLSPLSNAAKCPSRGQRRKFARQHRSLAADARQQLDPDSKSRRRLSNNGPPCRQKHARLIARTATRMPHSTARTKARTTTASTGRSGHGTRSTGCLHNCPYCYARDISERLPEPPPSPTGSRRRSAPIGWPRRSMPGPETAPTNGRAHLRGIDDGSVRPLGADRMD